MRISDWSSDVCSSDLTGYTGQLACEQLARSYGSELRWAMAGRDMAKLRSIQARFKVPSHVQLIEVDITDAAAAASLAKRARTILSTAGPFANVCDTLVAACAHHGTRIGRE